MSFYYSKEIIVQQNVSISLRRIHWQKLLSWMARYISQRSSDNPLDELVKCVLLQVFIKINSHLQKLALKGKPMNSKSNLKLTPAEKSALQFIINDEWEEIAQQTGSEAEQFFIAYLQPVLDKLHEIEINQGNSTALTLL